jgi:hypothetical protein
MSTQELEAYYLLESLRRFPFSETRDLVALKGYRLVEIMEYCALHGSSTARTLFANFIPLSSLSIAQ